MASKDYTVDGQIIYEGDVYMPAFPISALERVKTFNCDGDTLIASYPKTGTTWMQEIVWLIANDADFEGASKEFLTDRVRFMEMDYKGVSQMDEIEKLPHPRTIKTHLKSKFFLDQIAGRKMKVVIPLRNPKDTLVSYYAFYKMTRLLGNYKGTWDEFFELFRNKKLNYGDLIDWYLDWWQYKDDPLILFLKYEDMKKDLRSAVAKIAKFLEKDLTEQQIQQIASHCTFEEMKTNSMVNKLNYDRSIMDDQISPFMRKGKVGDWKEWFNADQNKYVDDLYETKLKPAGLTFDFEI